MLTVGLVAPLPPQIGGVASVAEWLLAHEREMGVRYQPYDLVRPHDEIGGRWSFQAAVRQGTVVPRFAGWLAGAPRILHVSVSCTATGLPRDALLVALVRSTGRTAIAHIHGPYDESLHRRGRRGLLRMVGRLADVVVAPSPTAADRLRSLGIDARWIPNPARLAEDAPDRNGAPSLRLLAVGRIGRGKGSFALVDALAAARAGGLDATLEFVGGESRRGDEAELRRLVEATGLDGAVRFTQPLAAPELAQRYASADVLCLPSEREGLPLAVLEGMSFGLPVLATRVGGVPDVVKDGRSGVLVGPGDVAGLTAGIRALADQSLRRRLGGAAREDVLRFASPDRIAAAWSDVYGALARGA